MKKREKFAMVEQPALDFYPILNKTNPVAGSIIMVLINLMRESDNVIMVSTKILEEKTGYKRVAISRALQYLESINWIKIYKSGNSNVYCINSEVAWKTDRSTKARAKFTATIVLAEEEQSSIKPTKLVNLSELKEIYGGSDE